MAFPAGPAKTDVLLSPLPRQLKIGQTLEGQALYFPLLILEQQRDGGALLHSAARRASARRVSGRFGVTQLLCAAIKTKRTKLR